MSTIYTASFNKLHRLTDYYQLAISNGLPSWFRGGRYKPLKPSFEYVRLLKSVQQSGMSAMDIIMFTNTYFEEVLDKLNPIDVYNDLINRACGKPVVLLSQEDSKEYSVRHVVREWFLRAGIDCQEIT